ncbi:hypothetical protein HK102_007886, partial [Quaeritorhiza haematococci]
MDAYSSTAIIVEHTLPPPMPSLGSLEISVINGRKSMETVVACESKLLEEGMDVGVTPADVDAVLEEVMDALKISEEDKTKIRGLGLPIRSQIVVSHREKTFIALGGLTHLSSFAYKLIQKGNKSDTDWNIHLQLVRVLRALVHDQFGWKQLRRNPSLFFFASTLFAHQYHFRTQMPSPSNPIRSPYTSCDFMTPLFNRMALAELLVDAITKHGEDAWKMVIDLMTEAGWWWWHEAHDEVFVPRKAPPVSFLSSSSPFLCGELKLPPTTFSAWLEEFESVVTEVYRKWTGMDQRLHSAFQTIRLKAKIPKSVAIVKPKVDVDEHIVAGYV